MGATPCGIAQNCVSTVQGLDLNAGLIGAWVRIGMITLGQLPVSVTDLSATAAALKS